MALRLQQPRTHLVCDLWKWGANLSRPECDERVFCLVKDYSLFSNEVYKSGWAKHFHEWVTVGSDRPYHYLGSGGFFVRLGDSFAGAMAQMMTK